MLKKTAPRVGIDSNGNAPLKGQITAEESLQTSETKEKTLLDSIIEATGCTVKVAEASVEYAKEKGAKSLKAYAIASIKKGFTGASVPTGTEINPRSFNNFEARDYDYDSLEKKLLGWDDSEFEGADEIQESTGYGFLNKYGIGTSIAN